MIVYVDIDLAEDKEICMLMMGFIIFLNQSPIYWFLNRQYRFELSIFARKFIVINQYCEYVRVFRYKLRILEIQVSRLQYIHSESLSIICNTTVTQSIMLKKYHYIMYHAV